MRRTYVLPLLLVCILGACAAREVLILKSGHVPPGIDFSGMWQLRDDVRREQQRLNEAIRKTDGVDDDDIFRAADLQQGRGEQLVRHRRDHGGLVYVFLQLGEMLKITQTPGALFISFDRAVVQEFRFGENRQVHVGPVVADRVSGWVGETYVVETLDENGMKLTERYAFGDDPNTLRRTIILRGSNDEAVTNVQVFDRIE